jgi:hypothetical protein
MLTRVSLDPDRHQKLSDVPLCVFGGVEEKPQHSGWKPSAADDSRLRQYRFIHRPKLSQRLVDLTMERRNQVPGCWG